MKVAMNIPRPDKVDLVTQGHRGPFFPLLTILHALTDINVWQMKQKILPWLYHSGIRYKEQLPDAKRGKGEDFLNAEELYQRQEGDCDQIAPYRAAELQVRLGIPAKVCIKWRWVKVTDKKLLKAFGHKEPFDLMLVHVLVCSPVIPRSEWDTGRWSWSKELNAFIEDPCVVLGMKGEFS